MRRVHNWPLAMTFSLVGAVGILVAGAIYAAAAGPALGSIAAQKAQFEQQQAARHAAALAGPRASKDSNHPPTFTSPGPPAIFDEGIVNFLQSPQGFKTRFAVVNGWAGTLAGPSSTEYLVYAGAEDTAASGLAPVLVPGVMVTTTAGPDGQTGSSEIGAYPAPGADGSLRITAMKSGVLTLETPAGQIYHFNVVALNYE